MKNPKVLVLGARGMIGRQVLSELLDAGIDVVGTTRSLEKVSNEMKANFVEFEAMGASQIQIRDLINEFDVVINTLGLIKQKIDENSSDSRQSAIELNAIFPSRLNDAVNPQRQRVIQIATDCVFSGKLSERSETSAHDAFDVYGKTKSLGEVPSNSFLNLRCSVIGFENSDGLGLLNWVISQPENAKISGYRNHLWNGITSQAFAKIVLAEVTAPMLLSGTFHIVPKDSVTKAELVTQILTRFERLDVKVNETDAIESVNRCLSTNFPDEISNLWIHAGYEAVPTIGFLVSTMPLD
jgi:dTDP-4-dehydrorhamnose reductase